MPILQHVNIDNTVAELGVNQRGDCYFTIRAMVGKQFKIGSETDAMKCFKHDLRACLMHPEIDNIVVESVGKKYLICTMKRRSIQGPNFWDYTVETQDDEQDTEE